MDFITAFAIGLLVLGILIAIFVVAGRQSSPVEPRLRNAPTITERPSPNHDERGSSIDTLVLHYTAIKTAEEALQRLCDPASGVSCHYLVDEQGKVYRLVDEDNRAWHAGVGTWDGRQSLNARSIGIEIANDGESEFPQAQMDGVRELCLWILSRRRIKAQNVIGHSDLAPGRKPDPGPKFDWKGLAAAGVGVWPQPEPQDYARSANWTDKQFRDNLTRYGYSSEVSLSVVTDAFQRHFQPEVFTSGKVGTPNPEAAARLAWLLRKKN